MKCYMQHAGNQKLNNHFQDVEDTGVFLLEHPVLVEIASFP